MFFHLSSCRSPISSQLGNGIGQRDCRSRNCLPFFFRQKKKRGKSSFVAVLSERIPVRERVRFGLSITFYLFFAVLQLQNQKVRARRTPEAHTEIVNGRPSERKLTSFSSGCSCLDLQFQQFANYRAFCVLLTCFFFQCGRGDEERTQRTQTRARALPRSAELMMDIMRSSCRRQTHE